ncbi:transposable element Tcb2 transposase [Trichonephila clavipes]|nr:transposable element Tcb2 transposase [Trichonephila clavipes]
MHNSRTPLHIVDRGSVTSQHYYREIILHYVHNLRGVVGSDFLFMDNNAWSNRSVEVSDTLQSENILRMQWPAYSPDLYPIGNAWDNLGRHASHRTINPRSV